jgi:GNAT superfamily N-acetyltransferase
MTNKCNYTVRKLEPTDSVNSFKTGSSSFAPLKTFIQKQAKNFQAAHVAQSYVAVNDDCVVLGFVALTCSEIDIRNGYGLADCEQASRYDSLPAIKIARLAIDSRHRQMGIGSNLIAHALDIAIGQISPAIGCRFIIADAKKEAISFYLNQGFTLLDTDDNKKRETPVMFFDLLYAL